MTSAAGDRAPAHESERGAPPSQAESPAGQGAVARVRAALAERGIAARIVEFAESTRTASDAARAVGTSVAQIVKSLVFAADGRPVLVLTSGARRVDVRKVAGLTGAARVEKAAAEAIREATGYSIGGVPPVGHRTPLPVLVDATLLEYPVVYAAAGTPHAVFPIAPRELVRVTDGTVGDVTE